LRFVVHSPLARVDLNLDADWRRRRVLGDGVKIELWRNLALNELGLPHPGLKALPRAVEDLPNAARLGAREV
jgi:hypothetical protein